MQVHTSLYAHRKDADAAARNQQNQPRGPPEDCEICFKNLSKQGLNARSHTRTYPTFKNTIFFGPEPPGGTPKSVQRWIPEASRRSRKQHAMAFVQETMFVQQFGASEYEFWRGKSTTWQSLLHDAVRVGTPFIFSRCLERFACF